MDYSNIFKQTKTESVYSGRSERSRTSPLSRMLASGEVAHEAMRPLTPWEKLDRWFVNEGSRRIFIAVFMVAHVMIFAFGFANYQIKDNLTTARATFGFTYPIARAAALVLHFDIAMLLFPVCRTLISMLRQTPLNGIVQFDKNITFHKLIAWSIVFFTWVHTIAHWNNFAQLAAKNNLGFQGFLLANFTTGPGWSGYIMLFALMAIVVTSIEKARRPNYERFWYTHHLFVLFFLFWSIHGIFGLIPADFAPEYFGNGTFYQYWIWSGTVYLLERVAREIRGRHRTYISKVIQHPGDVLELQIKKEHTKPRAGQYIFLNCPEVSLFQYHPFTLTSAPEEDYLSVHIRMVGDFTKSLGQTLGLKLNHQAFKEGGELLAEEGDKVLNRVLPRVYIDGPFGSASEDVFKYEIAILCGAGIGVTPFASILKSIWYRMNQPKQQQRTRLRKVYFFWIIRDFGSFAWFRSLLSAIEAQDFESKIEIHVYLTAKLKPDQAANIMVNEADAEIDAISGLRTPTNFGRPNWDAIFRGIKKIHGSAEAGLFFCGPSALGSVLHQAANYHSSPTFKFVWGKENF